MVFRSQGIAGLLLLLTLLFVPLETVAEESISPRDPCAPIFQSPCGEIDGVKKSKWFVGGHLEAGVYSPSNGRRNSFRSGFPDSKSGGGATLFNTPQSDWQLNQLYLNIGKEVDSRRGLDFGGRVDFMYGTDAVYVQSVGLERNGDRSLWNSGEYYTAIPQVFVEFGYKNFNVKFGKFLSPMDEETILSTDRFFYSLSETALELPQTFTGVVGAWEINKRLTVLGGWVSGEDETFGGKRSSAFLGDVFYRWTKHISVGYSAFVRMNSRDRIDGDTFVQSFSVNYSSAKWDTKFEWISRNPKSGTEGRLDSYGLRQELIYKVDPHWSVGSRIEWMRRHTKSGLGYDRYTITFGVNWKPTPHITIRPEIKYENCDGNKPYYKPKDGSPGGRRDRFTGGASAVITF